SCTQYLIQCVQFLLLFWWCTQYKIQCVQFLLHFWWCTQYKIQCSHYTVSNTVQVVYTVSNTVCTVSTTFLVVYTVSNTVCTVSTTLQVVYTVTNTVCTVSNILQAVYTVSNTVCTVSTTFLGLQEEADTHRPLKEGKQPLFLQPTVVVMDMWPWGTLVLFFSAAGRVIEPQHVTQAQSSLPSNAAAKVAYSTGSLSTVTPSVDPPSCMEESPELFNHSVGYMLLEDALQFEGSDVGSQVKEGSNMSLERGGATEG
ncbi:hypothetical protein AB205_0146840, partial [Aquarana catesbeiana]